MTAGCSTRWSSTAETRSTTTTSTPSPGHPQLRPGAGELPDLEQHLRQFRQRGSGNYITAERAKHIALAECPSGSTVVKCQFDWDDGRAEYEVEIRNGWTEYDFEIDAVTGTIFSRDIDNDRW